MANKKQDINANNNIHQEIERLKGIFVDIPEDKQKLLEGLFVQAARLRIRLNNLWADIEANGEYELFTQSEKTDPYERERPSARLFNSTDKNYQTIMKQLIEALPKDLTPEKEAEIMEFLGK